MQVVRRRGVARLPDPLATLTAFAYSAHEVLEAEVRCVATQRLEDLGLMVHGGTNEQLAIPEVALHLRFWLACTT
jgi:hypothetical protein